MCDCDIDLAKQRIYARPSEKENFYLKMMLKTKKKLFQKICSTKNTYILNTNQSLDICSKKVDWLIKKQNFEE